MLAKRTRRQLQPRRDLRRLHDRFHVGRRSGAVHLAGYRERNCAQHSISREAMEFLKRWPKGRRGPVFRCAERSCNAAIAGQMSVELARQSFTSFARIAGVLASSDLYIPPIPVSDPMGAQKLI